jgi:hypothetical protein
MYTKWECEDKEFALSSGQDTIIDMYRWQDPETSTKRGVQSLPDRVKIRMHSPRRILKRSG